MDTMKLSFITVLLMDTINISFITELPMDSMNLSVYKAPNGHNETFRYYRAPDGQNEPFLYYRAPDGHNETFRYYRALDGHKTSHFAHLGILFIYAMKIFFFTELPMDTMNLSVPDPYLVMPDLPGWVSTLQYSQQQQSTTAVHIIDILQVFTLCGAVFGVLGLLGCFLNGFIIYLFYITPKVKIAVL